MHSKFLYENSGISVILCYNRRVKNIIQFLVSQEDGVYTADGMNVPIVTDGNTFEELQENLKRAVELYFEDEDMAKLGFGSAPSILTNFEVAADFHARQA